MKYSKQAQKQGYTLAKFAATDTRRIGFKYYLANNGMLKEKFETLDDVGLWLECRQNLTAQAAGIRSQ